MKNQTFKQFYQSHVRKTQYAFQVKKCTDIDCRFHSWIQLDSTTFDDIKWLPSPQLSISDKTKYKTFAETHGSEPSDDDRPGKRKSETTAKAPFQLTPQRARLIAWCSECGYPRLLYCQRKLPAEDVQKIQVLLKDDPFLCGVEIDSVDVIGQKLYQHAKNNCYQPISAHYYHCRFLFGFKMICTICLDEMSDVRKKVPKCDNCKRLKK